MGLLPPSPARGLSLASELHMSKNPKTSLQMYVGFPEKGVTKHLHQPGTNLFGQMLTH
jgi:hypothetical protein